LRRVSLALTGALAQDWLERLRCDAAVLGASGVDTDAGADTTELSKAGVKIEALRLIVTDAGLTASPLCCPALVAPPAMTRTLLFACSLFLVTLGFVPVQAQGEAPRWWRGNLHTHSLWSDGDDYPEMIADWYKRHGYHFLAFSDHDLLQEGQRWLPLQGSVSFAGSVTHRGGGEVLEKYLRRFGPQWVEQRRNDGQLEIRLKPLSEFRTLFEEPGRFLLMPGIEVSHREVVASDGTKTPATVHVNVINPRDADPKPSGQTVLELLQRTVDAALAQRQRTGQAMFPHVNHPNFRWGLTPDDLMRVRGLRFFEVYNGHPQVNNEGDADHPSTERLWDLALTHRLTDLSLGILYGIATDDSHHYHEQAIGKSNSGRGWIMVRSSHLTPEFLVRAMEAGDFYASSGVTLAEVRRADGSLEIEIAGEPGVTYLTRFIGTRVRGQGPVEAGELGEERARSDALRSRYTLQPDDLYVRAVVTSSRTHPSGSVAHEFERAWTQPVVNERHAAFRNERGATPR
jgi:hypothetical protein